MDQRLSYFGGARPHRLTRNDTDLFAKAIVDYLFRDASVSVLTMQNIPCVFFKGRDVECLVRGDDWKKVFPYLKDQFFDTSMYPTAVRCSTVPLFFQTKSEMHHRVLTVLNTLFTVHFPEQN